MNTYSIRNGNHNKIIITFEFLLFYDQNAKIQNNTYFTLKKDFLTFKKQYDHK